MFRFHICFRIVWIVLCFGSAASRAGSDNVPLGANLDGVVDWSRTPVFADAIKMSRRFGSPEKPWADEGLPKLDPQGWPKEDFGVVVFSGQVHVGGTYKLSGESNVQPEVACTTGPGEVQNLQFDAAAKHFTADVVFPDDDQPTQLLLRITNTRGGVRALRLLRPGYDGKETFTKEFLDHVRRFSTFRFMDWEQTNNNPIEHWSDRPMPSDPSQTSKSVAWEYCIQLGNTLKHDIWINVPLKADDDYVRQLARLIHDKLDPSLHVYVEYSNEVWNDSFSQTHINRDLSVAEKDIVPALAYADEKEPPAPWTLGYRRTARRLKQIGDIFAEVYGPGEINHRVRPVLAGMYAIPDVAREGLEFIRRSYGPPKQFFYATASAPYFACGNGQDADANSALTKDQVLDALDFAERKIENDPCLRQNIGYATFYGLKHFAYEGGPDTFGPNNIQAKMSASHDSRLQQICDRYLAAWYANGGELFNWFTAGATNWSGQYGTWGLTDDIRDQDTPKIRALDAALVQPMPALSAGHTIPGEIDARENLALTRLVSPDPFVRFIASGTTFDYLLNVPADGVYNAVVSAGANEAGTTMELIVDDGIVQSVAIPARPSRDKGFMDSPAVPLRLAKGLNVLRLRIPLQRPYDINSIKITADKASARADALPIFDGMDFFWRQDVKPGATWSHSLELADVETPPAKLHLTPHSSNTSLLPDTAISITGTAATRTITVAPLPGQTGMAEVTLDLTDSAGHMRSVMFVQINVKDH